MDEKIRRKLRLRLAKDIINDQVGGAGWTHLDIALQVDRYSSKTILVKTQKCDQKGKIVLEPKARQKTSNYLVPKDPSDTTILDDVSVQIYPKKASWKQTYNLEWSVSGNVSLKAVEAVGFSAEGGKKTKRYVETTCTDLEHRSVDIEDLRNALCALSAQTSAEGMRDETSFLVVTDVLVAKEVRILEKQDSKKGVKVGVAFGVPEVNAGAGGGIVKEVVVIQEHKDTNVILAIKLARVHYDEQGSIDRAGVLAGGSYDGHYTLGSGNKDRERHYTVTTLATPIGVQKDKFKIKLNLLGRQNSTEVKVPQDVCETGQHQTRKSLPTGSKLLPLKGILVSMLKGKKSLLHRLHKHRISSKKDEKVTLSKVLVTDLEQDQTYICPCSEEKDVTDDRSLWFDCRQWRDEVAGNEFQVNVGGYFYSVYDEDPIVRVFGEGGCYPGQFRWTNPEDGDKGEASVQAARTFKDYGIKANAVIELIQDAAQKSMNMSRREEVMFQVCLPLVEEGCIYSPQIGLNRTDDVIITIKTLTTSEMCEVFLCLCCCPCYLCCRGRLLEDGDGDGDQRSYGGVAGAHITSQSPGKNEDEDVAAPRAAAAVPRTPRTGRMATCDLELTFEACQVTLRVGKDERIHTLPEKVLSLLEVYHGGQNVTDRQRLDDLGLQWPGMAYTTKIKKKKKEDDEVQETPADPNQLVFRIQDVNPDVTGFEIQVTVPETKLKMTVQKNDNEYDIMHRLRRVYAQMNVVHDGKVITDLTQTYRQLGIQDTAHVQLQSWDPENPPVVPTREEVEDIEEAIESLIQELQGVEQGNEDSDSESEEITKEQTEDQNVWSVVRRILWRHLELRDGDPDIPPGALAMLIRAVGEDTVTGEVLQTILEAALERQGEGGTEGATGGADGAQ